MRSTLVFAQFAVLLGLFLVYAALSVFLDDDISFIVPLVFVLVLPLSFVVVLGHTLWRPSWRKTRRCGVVIIAATVAFLAGPQAGALGTWLFVKSRQMPLEAFIRDIDSYGRIRGMSDGQRHFKDLNGELITFGTRDGSSPRLSNELPIETVLARDGIDRARYEQFRQRLIGLRLIAFDATPTYVAFLHGGMLDNLSGLMYVRAGSAPPPLQSSLFMSNLIGLRHITGNWYWFRTT